MDYQFREIDHLAINTLRALAMDAVQAAGTGHPGTPMGAADTAYVLWSRFLRHNPADPAWPNRDRFVLSAGHASMLLYSLLFLTGYDLPLEELKRFRRAHGRTPGHPELGLTPGVEATTGPLGQGFAMGVGMAIAQCHLAAYFNRPGHEILDHHIYAFVSDGDMMEGISSEAASLAGHLRLGKLVYLYDDNRTTIEGSTELSFTEDRAMRFESYGWHVQRVDGYDLNAIAEAIAAARLAPQPSLVIARTHIAYGSPNKQDRSSAHGAPLGVEEVRLTKQKLGWPVEPAFRVPEEVLRHGRQALENGREWQAEWEVKLQAYGDAYPALAAELRQTLAGTLPANWAEGLPTFAPQDGPVAPRVGLGKALSEAGLRLPTLIGGSADLASSTNTAMVGVADFDADHPAGRNLRFGVREHAMAGILNGMALYRGLIPFGSTYLVFSDYMRPSIRLAALMGLHIIYIFTHDSVLVGTDGPTHQPVEHVASLRAVPNLLVVRPADANEAVASLRLAIEHSSGPVALILARHPIPVLPSPSPDPVEALRHGGYVLADPPAGTPALILIATGSEVHLTLQAHKILAGQGIATRVVNMPCPTLFARQSEAYRQAVLPDSVPLRLAVEAGNPDGWFRFVGSQGDVLGVDRFGLPGSTEELAVEFGLTAENVVVRALALLSGRRPGTEMSTAPKRGASSPSGDASGGGTEGASGNASAAGVRKTR